MAQESMLARVGLTTESGDRPAWLQTMIVVASYAFLIAFAIIMISPFIYTISNSFKPAPEIAQSPASIIPDTFTLEHYRKLAQGSVQLPRWTFNSLLFAVVVTVGRLFLDSLAGYALARLRFPGRDILFLGILGTMMIPGVVLLIPRFIILKQLNLLGSYPGVIFPLLADAFGIFLMKQFFESIPTEIEEAARVDGAGPFRTYFQVVLPMATPALTALTIFSFQGTWNDLLTPLIALGPTAQEKWPLTLGLANIKGSAVGQTLDFGLFLSASFLMTIPIAILFFIFQRYFVEGVSYSGLKG